MSGNEQGMNIFRDPTYNGPMHDNEATQEQWEKDRVELQKLLNEYFGTNPMTGEPSKGTSQESCEELVKLFEEIYPELESQRDKKIKEGHNTLDIENKMELLSNIKQRVRNLNSMRPLNEKEKAAHQKSGSSRIIVAAFPASHIGTRWRSGSWRRCGNLSRLPLRIGSSS